MPIYEYVCKACGHETEALQKMSDTPLSTCPSCAQEALARKVSAAGFRLKGGGWYETDFKKSGKRNVAGDASDGGSSDKSEKKSEKSETKADSGCSKPGCATAA